MQIKPESDTPIFAQIAAGIEDAILAGAFQEGTQIPSITEFSASCRINPATALKGINLLVDEGILYKKRGLGMFVSEGAIGILTKKRKSSFYEKYVETLVAEAKHLHINEDELKSMIGRGYSK